MRYGLSSCHNNWRMLHSSRVEMRTSPECEDGYKTMPLHACTMQARDGNSPPAIWGPMLFCQGQVYQDQCPAGAAGGHWQLEFLINYSFLVKLAHAVKWALPFLYYHTCKLYYSGCDIDAYHRNVTGHHSVTISSLVSSEHHSDDSRSLIILQSNNPQVGKLSFCTGQSIARTEPGQSGLLPTLT